MFPPVAASWIIEFLDFDHRPVFFKTHRFGSWTCFRLQVWGTWHILCWVRWKELPSITDQKLNNPNYNIQSSEPYRIEVTASFGPSAQLLKGKYTGKRIIKSFQELHSHTSYIFKYTLMNI
jgi:hypothetical protein